MLEASEVKFPALRGFVLPTDIHVSWGTKLINAEDMLNHSETGKSSLTRPSTLGVSDPVMETQEGRTGGDKGHKVCFDISPRWGEKKAHQLPQTHGP